METSSIVTAMDNVGNILEVDEDSDKFRLDAIDFADQFSKSNIEKMEEIKMAAICDPSDTDDPAVVNIVKNYGDLMKAK
jgi:hypothetical protein